MGLIVGQSSFGKGLVQRIYTINDTISLKVTTSKYYIPSGRLIQKKDYLDNDVLTDGLEDRDSIFYTKNGRVVKGGGGINPDIKMEREFIPFLVRALYKDRVFLTFVSKYAYQNAMELPVIIDEKKGSTSINKTDKDSIDDAVKLVLEMAEGSQPDDAYDISEKQPPQSFSKGDTSANLDNMYQSLEGFVDYVNSTYPKINLEAAIMDFNHSRLFFQNTNGVDFEVREGMYGFSPMFLSKDGENTSSFNYTGIAALKIDNPLHTYGTIDTLLKQSVEQLHTESIKDKFVGTLLVTPDCISDFLGFVIGDISDGKMVSGNALYKDKLNQQIASSDLTFHSHPISDEIADGYFLTSDGYVAKNATIIHLRLSKKNLPRSEIVLNFLKIFYFPENRQNTDSERAEPVAIL